MNASCKQTLLAGCLLIFSNDIIGQVQQEQQIKIYNAIIKTVSQGKRHKGPLLELTDSSITILSKDIPETIPSDSISIIKFQRKASIGRGAIAGVVTGFYLGVIAGFISGDDDNCPSGPTGCSRTTASQKALAGGLVFSAIGSFVGVIIGASSSALKIEINGDRKVFLVNNRVIRKYGFNNPSNPLLE